MDKTTVIGMIGAFGMVIMAIVLGGVGFAPYIDVPSIFIVFGGTIAVVSGQYRGENLTNIGKAIGVAFKPMTTEEPEDLIRKMINYATQTKKGGMMSIEGDINNETNPFLKEAFLLVLDNNPADVIGGMLQVKMDNMSKRHQTMIEMMGSVGGVAGSMGMIGTLVGLVAMLANLSDPAAVGPAMAVALLTTMYGAMVGTLFAGIIETKLTQKNSAEMLYCSLVKLGATLVAADGSIGATKMQLSAALREPLEEG